MAALFNLWDTIMNLDTTLFEIIKHYGSVAYLFLFLVIFCETGLVVTPFLPGDSLLFMVGAVAASGSLRIELAGVILFAAAVIGDSTNYLIGRVVGPKIFAKEHVRFLKKEHLQRTHNFYERHGKKTIILARFIPIVRTFAPFVAGIGRMRYMSFLSYSVAGSLVWVSIFTLGGYFFGNLPAVKHNFSFVVMMIVIISVLPAVITYLRERKV